MVEPLLHRPSRFQHMVALARIAVVAMMGSLGVTVVWWFFGSFGNFFGLPGAEKISPWVIGGAAGLLAGCGEAWRVFVERRRRRMCFDVASNLGCEFTDHLSPTEIRSWPAICLFRYDAPSGSNRMTGMYNGREIDVFDFRYTVPSSGDSASTTSHQTVYRFPDGAPRGVHFLLKPRPRIVGVLSSLLGGTELELSPPDETDSDQASRFATVRKRYQITLPDGTVSSRELRSLFHPLVVGWLSLHPGWSMEAKGNDLFAWKSDVTAVGSERLERLDELREIMALMEASDRAVARLPAVRVEVRTHDRTLGLAGFLGLLVGIFGGSLVGGMLWSLVVSLAFRFLPQQQPKLPIAGPLLFALPIAMAALGGYYGWRLGRRSKWGRHLAARLNPIPSQFPDTKPATDVATND